VYVRQTWDRKAFGIDIGKHEDTPGASIGG